MDRKVIRMKSLITGTVTALTLLIIGFVLWSAAKLFIEVPFGISLVANYQSMPADDYQLEQWLRVQPGVDPDFVIIERRNRSLYVQYTIVRNLRDQPALPAVDAKCRALGYVGGPFRDDPTGREFDMPRR
jgi:hypothetical protein